MNIDSSTYAYVRDPKPDDDEDESDDNDSDSGNEELESPTKKPSDSGSNKIGSSPPSGATTAARDLIIDEPDVTTSPV